MTVCHITSAHPRTDIRIFIKQCCSLAQAGYKVVLLVADGYGDEKQQGVNIFDVCPPSKGRLARMVSTVDRLFTAAKNVDADIYHLHDPELLRIALKLKKLGKCVIYDAHEDLPSQIAFKPYLSKLSRILLPPAIKQYEFYVTRNLDAIVAATPHIRDKFQTVNSNAVDINNYPLLQELYSSNLIYEVREARVCYVGSISEIRGIYPLVQSLPISGSSVRLSLAGRFSETEVAAKARTLPGWQQVDELGHVDRHELKGLFSKSIAGIVTFLRAPNHIYAQPNKMFEYMSAGLPVIASNFPLWKEIIHGNECGLCVNPEDPKEIADAIHYLAANPQEIVRMGKNGRSAVERNYNWETEKEKLLALYQRLMHRIMGG
ncbi:glycosyltransferase [Pusillimonas caeni]|nr:glycosyltransferase [Pusillimonas caeni]